MRSHPTFLALLLLALPWHDVRADDAEDRAVQAIQKLGGKVTRHKTDDGKPVIAVQFHDKTATDADLKALAA